MSARCRCEQCAPDNPGETYTEAFRHACEARWVADLGSHVERRRYLNGVWEARGGEEYKRLRASAWALLSAPKVINP